MMLTDFERRALKLLTDLTETRLVRPGFFGSCLWPETNRPTWAFARPAGNVLNRLRARGFAEWQSTGSRASKNQDWGWRATDAGKKEAAR